MWKTKEESGCFTIESNTSFLSVPMQISGLVFIGAALILVSICKPFIGCFLALVGGCLVRMGAKLARSREITFDPYTKKVFWTHKEGTDSRIGSFSFDDITHVLLEKGHGNEEHEGLSLLVDNEKHSVLGDVRSLKGADKKSLEALASRIRKIVGAY